MTRFTVHHKLGDSALWPDATRVGIDDVACVRVSDRLKGDRCRPTGGLLFVVGATAREGNDDEQAAEEANRTDHSPGTGGTPIESRSTAYGTFRAGTAGAVAASGMSSRSGSGGSTASW